MYIEKVLNNNAFISLDENGEETEVPDLDENGNEQYTYGIRYAEFIMLNTHMLQKLYKKTKKVNLYIC